MKRIIIGLKRFYIEAKEFFLNLKDLYREFRFCSIAFLVLFALTPCVAWGFLNNKNGWLKATPAIIVTSATLVLVIAFFLLNRMPVPDVTPPPVLLPLHSSSKDRS